MTWMLCWILSTTLIPSVPSNPTLQGYSRIIKPRAPAALHWLFGPKHPSLAVFSQFQLPNQPVPPIIGTGKVPRQPFMHPKQQFSNRITHGTRKRFAVGASTVHLPNQSLAWDVIEISSFLLPKVHDCSSTRVQVNKPSMLAPFAGYTHLEDTSKDQAIVTLAIIKSRPRQHTRSALTTEPVLKQTSATCMKPHQSPALPLVSAITTSGEDGNNGYPTSLKDDLPPTDAYCSFPNPSLVNLANHSTLAVAGHALLPFW